MKMLFIYPNINTDSIDFSPALENLSSYIKSKGVDAELIHINDTFYKLISYEDIYIKIKRYNPDLIGFTAVSIQYEYANEIAGYLKKRGIKTPIILGGIHAIINKEDIEDSNIDAFCIGEGEIPLFNLIKSIKNNQEYWKTRGFHFKYKGELYKNGSGDVVQNLNDLNVRDYSIINGKDLLEKRNNVLSVSFSRGCVYDCGYCINNSLKKIFKNSSGDSYFRIKSPYVVIDELLYYINYFDNKISIFNFDDDLLLLNKKWFYEFSELYYNKIYKVYKIGYYINSRIDLVTPEIVKRMVKSGCKTLRVGVETGNENLRVNILNKHISNGDIVNFFNMVNKFDIRVFTFFMMGVPNESKSTIEETIDLIAKIKPHMIRISLFQAYKYTNLYNYCLDNRLLKYTLSKTSYFENSDLIFDDLEKKDLENYYLMLPWYINIKYIEDLYIVEMYESLIKRYISINILGNKSKLLKDDTDISRLLTAKNISHFKFFNEKIGYIILSK